MTRGAPTPEGPATGLPLLVDVRGRRVVVVGGGPVAAGKTRAVLAAGGDVLLVAPEAIDELHELADSGRVRWDRRTYAGDDLDGAWLAVAATSSASVNAAVAAAADHRRIWCVRVDDARAGSASLLGTVRRGALLLAVSTSGLAPALTVRLRRELAGRYGPEWGVLTDIMGELRADPDVRDALAGMPAAERRARWHEIFATGILTLIRLGHRRQAKEVAKACLCSSSD